MVAQGPWGGCGCGGGGFSDGRGDVVEVTVKYNDNCLTMLQVAYEHGGARFQGDAHGYDQDGEESKVNEFV